MKNIQKKLVEDVEVVASGYAQGFATSLFMVGSKAADNADHARQFARICDAHFSPNDPNREFYDVFITEALAASKQEQQLAEDCVELAVESGVLVSTIVN